VTIVAMRKVTLCGPAGDKEAVIEDLQRLGCVHLVPLAPLPKAPENQPSAHPVDAYKALRYLTDVRDKRRQVTDPRGFEMQDVVVEVLENRRLVRETEDLRDALRERCEALKPWGDFHLPPPEDLNGLRLWFYIVPVAAMVQVRDLELPWQVVHRDNRFAYVAIIAAEEPPAAVLPIPRTHTGALSLSEVQRRLDAAEIELEDLLARRQALTRWCLLVARNLARAEDRAARLHAASQALDRGGLFALQGWLPVPDQECIQAFAARHHMALLMDEPALDERPPTLLDNPPALAGGQDLVDFYQTPGYRAWDPSIVVFLSFTLFFAMILSDAGYASVFALVLFAGWRRLGASPLGRRLRVLGAALVGGALVWGILAGSYFGVTPPEGSALAALRLLDINDFETMMRLSVGIGVTHIAIANASMAWQAWGTPRAPIALAWIGVLLGGFLLWLGQTGLGRPLSSAGSAFLICGLAVVFWFAGARPVRRPSDVLLWLLEGLRALTDVTKAFGDVLSYLRLFALGLASASLALTFNDLAHQAAVAYPGLGLLLALLILLVGHVLNLALSLMSGVVHGLRLNFIEFYNWGLSEEGYPFKAFAKREETQ
jgi:V/A-type H+/Na+-transporting ATPase subunit I